MARKNLFISLVLASFLFVGLLLAFSPITINISRAIKVTPDTKVEMHDVVRVNYTLYVGVPIVDNQEGVVYVEDPDVIKEENVPEKIKTEFPDIWAPPNVGFMEGMLGMKAGEEKTHPVDSESGKGFTNVSDPYYGEDLFYVIRLKEILLDSSSSTTTLFDNPLFILFVVLIGLVISILIILRIQRYSRSHDLFGLKIKCNVCGNIANAKCGNPGCNTPYCKKCFLENNRCELCHSNTMVPLK